MFSKNDFRGTDITDRKEKKIDRFLFAALIILTAGILVFNIVNASVRRVRRTDLVLAGQWEALLDNDTLAGLIVEFEEQNPLLRILRAEPEKVPAENETAPSADIMIFDDSRLGSLLTEDALYPLASLEENQNNGYEWAVPLVLSMDLLFYNIDLLQQAGFDRPPKTRDEFIKYSQALAGGTIGARGAAPGLSPEDPLALTRDFFSWLWAAGIPLVTDGQPRFEGRAASDLVAFMGQLNSLNAPGDDPFGKTGAQRLREFAEGRLAMVIAPAHAISSLGESGFRFGVTVVPTTSAPGKNMLGLSGFYGGISGASVHPEEAWTFLAFLAEKIPGLPAKIKTVPGSIPGIFTPAADFSVSRARDEPLYAKAWEIFDTSDIAENFAAFPRAAVFENIVREELRAFFARGGNPRDTAAAIQKRWEELY